MINDGNDNGSAELGFDYDLLVEDALKNVVKKVLKLTAEKGLIGNSHFFISFNGNFKRKVYNVISKRTFKQEYQQGIVK